MNRTRSPFLLIDQDDAHKCAAAVLVLTFNDLSMDEKQDSGKLTSIAVATKSDLDVTFMALCQELDKCSEPFSTPQAF